MSNPPAHITKALASLSKAWPVLADHASHMDGEFDNALTTVRRYIESLTPPPSPRVRLLDGYRIVNRHNVVYASAFDTAGQATLWLRQYDDEFPNQAPHRVVRVALVDEGVSDAYTLPALADANPSNTCNSSPLVVVTEANAEYGPTVTTTRSCDGCKACKADSYTVQGDSGFKVKCLHPALPTPKTIGDTTWVTPKWCPALADADAGEVTTLSAAATSVLAERERQRNEEGWTEAHDDDHYNGELADAAASYAVTSWAASHMKVEYGVPAIWPWDRSWYKRGDRRRDLVKAGALILAEIERLDRAALSRTPDADAGGAE